MNIVYVRRTSNADEMLVKWKKKFPLYIKRKIAKNKVVLEKDQEDLECKVFFSNNIKDKEIETISQDIVDKITTNGYKNVVISNELKQYPVIYRKLQKLNILNGRWLFNYLIYDVIEYILEKKKTEISQSEISILINNTTDTNIQNILKLAEKAKVLNIVTENIAIFKQIEEKLYNEKGIMIRVTNNKKRSLLKSDIIINLDFDEDTIGKYNIPTRRSYSKCEQINNKK